MERPDEPQKPRLPLPKWTKAINLSATIRACDYVHVTRDAADPDYPYVAKVVPRGRQMVRETGINAVDALGAALVKAFPELAE